MPFAAYRLALEIEPESIEANFGAATVLLSRGRFAEGWRHYLHRDSMKAAPTTLVRERLPINLAGRRVLVLADQGLGDEIFFLRFAPALRARGAKIAYRSEPRLHRMLRRAPIAERILAEGEAWEADLTVAVGDLPYLLGASDHQPIPAAIAIPALAECQSRMAARLTALGPPPHVGVTWRAGTRGVARRLDK
jgi:hypothetical protein